MANEFAKILAATARLETLAEAHQREISALTEVTTKRLNGHSSDIESLKLTRARQYGGAKLLGILSAMAIAITGFFGYGGK